MAVWLVLAIVDPCQTLLLKPLHRYASVRFSYASYLGKLFSVQYWAKPVRYVRRKCSSFSMWGSWEPFGRRQFFVCPLTDVAAWCNSANLLHQLPSLKLLQGDLVAVGVLSGNRNFEGRVHPNTRANYLASPPLVIAYAIAGTVPIDFEKEPLGKTLWNASSHTL